MTVTARDPRIPTQPRLLRSDLRARRVFWQLHGTRIDHLPEPTLGLIALVDLDLATEDRARAELAAACIGSGTHQRILVRIGEQCFVDVRGLAVLLDASRLAARRGRRFAVVDPPPSLRLCLSVLGPDETLEVVARPKLRDALSRGRRTLA